jgi:predicted RNase H-like HicB family nuclease
MTSATGLGPTVTPKYAIAISWSPDDEAFVAEVPELPGCMADGPTYPAALAAAEDAIRIWMETARELGREIPAPGSHRASA